MSRHDAIRLALDLFHVPSRVQQARVEPLPEGTGAVLLIAAGDRPAIAEAVAAVERDRDTVVNAAVFFVEQLLLAPDADSYRVLGADASGETGDLRRNMALLLRWLHPDVDRNATHSLFASRVTAAWETLKTAERRAAYDAQLQAMAINAAAHLAAPRKRRRKRVVRYVRIERRGMLRRFFSFLLGRTQH